MNFRLKTSKYTAEKLKQLQGATGLTPNILARIAVSLALRQPETPTEHVLDINGLDFNRSTLTGEHDFIYKALITQHFGQEISDEEYFPNLFNSYLEHGIRVLANEYQHAGNYEKLVINLLHQ
ncbi:DndE family protein [Bacillus haynesii]|uniref:DndE family protein n=1 Tax=Bacillus haynesii TaxID=1925021 RepID=UPI00227E4519|nr:DndE family protein [Bacillus haynesii]MCY8101189.1 DndE family protein [Bacillus haynesii]MCY8470755.1 DndE family protein [Bacillus haynesii]